MAGISNQCCQRTVLRSKVVDIPRPKYHGTVWVRFEDRNDIKRAKPSSTTDQTCNRVEGNGRSMVICAGHVEHCLNHSLVVLRDCTYWSTLRAANCESDHELTKRESIYCVLYAECLYSSSLLDQGQLMLTARVDIRGRCIHSNKIVRQWHSLVLRP